MKRGKTLSSFLVFKYRFRSTINTIFEFVNQTLYFRDLMALTQSDKDSSLRKLYGRHHDLVDRYGISVSQMTTDMFHSFEASEFIPGF